MLCAELTIKYGVRHPKYLKVGGVYTLASGSHKTGRVCILWQAGNLKCGVGEPNYPGGRAGGRDTIQHGLRQPKYREVGGAYTCRPR